VKPAAGKKITITTPNGSPVKVFRRADGVAASFATADVVASGTAMEFDGNAVLGVYNFDGSTDVPLTVSVVLGSSTKSAQTLCSTLVAALGVTAILNFF